VEIFSLPVISNEIKLTSLDLLAFLEKEKKLLADEIRSAAKTCALLDFQGDLNRPIPAIVLWYAEQDTLSDLSAHNLANLVEINIR
jgi:FKBP12-rapamycin complex-associated protein